MHILLPQGGREELPACVSLQDREKIQESIIVRGPDSRPAKVCEPMRKALVVAASFAALLCVTATHLYARQELEIIYSANINGYVDPCG